MISSHYQCSTSQLYFTVRGKTCNNFNSCQCLLGKEWKNVTWDDWNRDMMMFHLYNGDIMPINICTVSQSGIILCFCQGNSMGKRLCRLLYVNTPPKNLASIDFPANSAHLWEWFSATEGKTPLTTSSAYAFFNYANFWLEHCLCLWNWYLCALGDSHSFVYKKILNEHVNDFDMFKKNYLCLMCDRKFFISVW